MMDSNALVSALLPLTWAAVLFRAWTRHYIIHTFDWDDVVLIVTECVYTGYCGIQIVRARVTSSIPVADLGSEQSILKMLMRLSQAGYILSRLLAKISISILFIKICGSHRRCRLAVMGQLGMSTATGLFSLLLASATCAGAPPWLWSSTGGQKSTCPWSERLLVINAVWSTTEATTYLALGGLALYLMYDASDIPRSKKAMALVLLLFSTFGSSAAYVRSWSAIDNLKHSTPSHLATISFLSTLDAGLCILTISLVTVRPPILRLWALYTSHSSANNCRRAKREADSTYFWSLESGTRPAGKDQFRLVTLTGDVPPLPEMPKLPAVITQEQEHEVEVDSWDIRYATPVRLRGESEEANSKHACNRALETYGLI